jgi:hypothetical protein
LWFADGCRYNSVAAAADWQASKVQGINHVNEESLSAYESSEAPEAEPLWMALDVGHMAHLGHVFGVVSFLRGRWWSLLSLGLMNWHQLGESSRSRWVVETCWQAAGPNISRH